MKRMRSKYAWLAAALAVAGLTGTSQANTTWYVWTNSPANGPGTNWATAFRSIQSAVDVASSNDTVLVTNGIYTTSTWRYIYGKRGIHLTQVTTTHRGSSSV